MKRIALFGSVAALIIALAVVLPFFAAPAAAQDSPYKDLPQARTEQGFPTLGRDDAPITLVEFSNFSCPGCMQYTGDVKTIVDSVIRDGSARLIFMPMIFGDDPSLLAAQGALCADKQSGFWPMHDSLFQIHKDQGARVFTVEIVQNAAQALGLDGAAVAACIASGETRPIVQASISVANAVGVQYTPTLMYSMDGGKTLEWFPNPQGGKFDSSVPPLVVKDIVTRAQAGQITPAPTVTPTPVPVDPFGFDGYQTWSSADGALKAEIPSNWEAQLSPQNGPLGWLISPPGSEYTGIAVLALPFSELGAAPTDDPMALANSIFAGQAGLTPREAEAGTLKAAAVKQTIPQSDPVTGKQFNLDRDLWFVILDANNVLIFQAIAETENWNAMQAVLDRFTVTLSVDLTAAASLLGAAFPTPVPAATAIAGFTPAEEGKGPCVGVKGVEGATFADGKGKQFTQAEQVIDASKVYCAILTTDKGQIVIQLYPEIAPQHVNSFVFLAREGFFNGVTFHRVIPDFVAQTGDPTGTGTGGPGYGIPLETNPSVSYDRIGVLGMARATDPNSAGSQFFITYAPLPNLNPSAQSEGYTIFGQVIEGMDFVRGITARDPSTAATPGDTLISVEIVELAK